MVRQRKTNTTEKEEVVAESSSQPVELNPKTVGYEFGGPVGALGMIVGLPIVVMILSITCGPDGYPSKALLDDWQSFFAPYFTMDFVNSLLDPWAFLFYTGFVFLLAILYPCLPSDLIPGTRLRDGTVKKYRNNGKNNGEILFSKQKKLTLFFLYYFSLLLISCHLFHFLVLVKRQGLQTTRIRIRSFHWLSICIHCFQLRSFICCLLG
jgi:hypothetical protein